MRIMRIVLLARRSALRTVLLLIALWLVFSPMRLQAATWVTHGPAQVVLALAIDPTTTPSTLYAGTGDGGGVFKSTNGGGSWNPVNTGLPLDSFGTLRQVTALAIDPHDPVHPGTVYAGTYGDGVFKSTNGGTNWSAFNIGLVDLFVRALETSWRPPAPPQAGFMSFYAGNDDGVSKATGSGASSWAFIWPVPHKNVGAIAADPTAPGTLYAGTDNHYGPGASGLFKSTDDGLSWNPTSISDSYDFTVLAIDPTTTPATVYVGTVYNGLWKSSDGGGSWNEVSGLAGSYPTPLIVAALAIDPTTTPATVYAGVYTGAKVTYGLWKSTDGGESLDKVDNLPDSVGIVRALAIDPTTNPSTLYAGAETGVYRLTAVCGDGEVDPGEECDEGTANGSASCCTTTCTLRSSGSCDDDGHLCTQDVCNGSSGACQHRVEDAGTECRPLGGACDVQHETCNGSSIDCPDDGPFKSASTICHAATGLCDVDVFCTGDGPSCPSDAFKPGSEICRPAVDACDADEFCPGDGPGCPADHLQPYGTTCPSDGFDCTLDKCDGNHVACQHVMADSSIVCRPAAGQCDLPENCTGSSPTCPLDTVKDSGTPCNDVNACTDPDSCNGSGQCVGTAKDCREKDTETTTCTGGKICTADSCNPATGGCTHTCISGCDPNKSTDELCDPSTTCTLSTPDPDNNNNPVELTIPPGCLTTPKVINIISLGTECPEVLGTQGKTPKIASCTQFLPHDVEFSCSTGVTMKFKWKNTSGSTCKVAYPLQAQNPLYEGQLKLLRDGEEIAPSATSGCGTFAAKTNCPEEHPQPPFKCDYKKDPSFCAPGSDTTCDPNENSWTVQAMKFSEYAIAKVCVQTGPTQLRVGRLDTPGKGRFSIRGKLTAPGAPLPVIDPVANGLRVRFNEASGSTLDTTLAGGAYWRVNASGQKWTYYNATPDPPAGIYRVVLDLKKNPPRFSLAGKRGSYTASTDMEPELIMPDTEECFVTRFAAGSCRKTGSSRGDTLNCR